MKISRMSPITGRVNTLDLPVDEAQLQMWKDGELIQNAMPDLTADQREFIMTGLYPGEFEMLVGDPDDPEDTDLFDDESAF